MIPMGPAPVMSTSLTQNRKGKRRVCRIAERIENRGDFHRDFRIGMPDIGDRNRKVFGVRAGTVDAHTAGFVAQMTTARQTVATAPAHDVPLARDHITDFQIRDVAAHRGHRPDEFMADRHGNGDRFLRPCVPFINVDIGTADGGFMDLDQHIVDPDLGHVHFLEPESGPGLFLDQRLHFLLHRPTLPSCLGFLRLRSHPTSCVMVLQLPNGVNKESKRVGFIFSF
jgi:hypothetical protein